MKKTLGIVSISSVLASSLLAGSLEIQNGWNLKGADRDINVSELGCAKTIWKYDESNASNPWSLYNKDDNSSHSFNTFSTINQGEGFWVHGEGCDGNSGVVDPQTIHAFGFEWENRKFFEKSGDSRYLVSGNTAFLNTDGHIEVVAVKDAGNDSRSEVKENILPTNKVEAKVNLSEANASKNRGEMITFLYDVTFDSSLNTVNSETTGHLYISQQVRNDKVSFWMEIEDSTGNVIWSIGDNYDNTIVNQGFVNQPVKLTTEVVTNGIKFTVEEENGTLHDKTYTEALINFDFIDSVRFRSRTDDRETSAADKTVFKVEGVEINNVIYDETTTLTPDFTSLPTNFISIFDDEYEKNSYEKVTNNTTTFGFVESEYEKDHSNNTYSWQTDSETFNVTVSNLTTNTFNYTTSSNEQGTFTTESLNKVLVINGISYSGTGDLYELISERVVTNVGDVEWETADWTPKSYNNGQETTITNITDFVNDSLTSGHWFDEASGGGVNMISGNPGDTSGNVVRAIADGVWDGCTEGDCTKYVRTSEVIGSWTLANDELKVESNESDEIHWSRYTNSTFEQGWQSKLGSTEKHKFYYSSDSSITDVENFTRTVIENHPHNH